MKIHTTNYYDTFIEVAEDTKTDCGTKPPTKEKKTIAEIQYDLIANHPYKYTFDDILFQVYAIRNDLVETEYKEARERFFSKGQPCFRTSPLAKTYGFGIHHNNNGKIAIYGMETTAYQKYLLDTKTRNVTAMKSSK